MALKHGFTVNPGEDLDRLQLRIKKALDTLAAAATASQLVDKGKYITVGSQNLQDDSMGHDLASASVICPTKAYHHLTGGSTVSFLATTGTFNGFRVELACTAATTFNNGAASPPPGTYAIHTLTGAATAIGGGKVIALRRDDELQNWIQVA